MSDIGPISRSTAGNFPPNGRIPASYTSPSAPATPRAGDAVELSRTAQLLSKLRDLPDVRQDLVDRVKSEIANGSYETPDKIGKAVDNLLDELS